MLTEKAISKNGTFTHSGKSLTLFGNHFDGENFYFFESDEERILFFNSLPKENVEPQNEAEATSIERKQQNEETKNETEIKKVELTIMQTHENTNVLKPTMIGKRPVYKSKMYKLNILDIIKGFIVSVLSAMLFAVQQMADSGTLELKNYKPILMVAISAGAGYLIKNLFTDNSKK